MGISHKNDKSLGRVLRGFEHITRYWDKDRDSVGAKILPGEYYVTITDEYITTVLGSCVSACIRDRVLGIGGMNHFMLPEGSGTTKNTGASSDAERYGNYAMEHMINDILKNGARRENLEVKIFGGGKILRNMSDIGLKNIEFVRHYIQTEGMNLISEDVGEEFPRKVVFFPATGKALVKRLRSLHNDTLIKRERSYLNDIQSKPIDGDIELF
ncbi:MAG: chemoreceptor glutamine deamidase CheD [Gammaproteobacteria bacterium]|nr:chemoreceptor glutamine deamidase CheD [Gammaproteobacteria bacterium]MDH5728409.1 chemoreceptor glutamine deamidase CheD [Gammaproteobacteria bacterium]